MVFELTLRHTEREIITTGFTHYIKPSRLHHFICNLLGLRHQGGKLIVTEFICTEEPANIAYSSLKDATNAL